MWLVFRCWFVINYPYLVTKHINKNCNTPLISTIVDVEKLSKYVSGREGFLDVINLLLEWLNEVIEFF